MSKRATSDERRATKGERRVAFATLGCKANWTDTEEMIQKCRALGMRVVPFDGEADAYVVNTCTVTRVADKQSRQMIRRARRKNPEAVVIACGCLGEVDRQRLSEIEGIDAVFGTSDRGRAIEYLRKRLNIEDWIPADTRGNDNREDWIPADNRGNDNRGPQSRARAFLKIQDGCNRACAYCIVPKARGPARSVAPERIIESCLALSRHHREIVFTGIDIGQYKMDIPVAPLPLTPSLKGRENGVSHAGRDYGSEGCGLFDLLAKLADFEWMPRLRISSIDPNMVNAQLIQLLRTGNICRHIHLSIQSASDRVLRSMGRGYSGKDVEDAVMKLTDAVEGIAVTGDVIAGFPGEETKEHAETVSLFEKLPFAGLHVFPYSERAGTKAAAMPGKILFAERARRAEELRELAAEKRKKFLAKLVGTTLNVIVTSKVAGEDGLVGAFSDNAVNVLLPQGEAEYGEIGQAKITQVDDLKVRGLWDFQKKTKTS